MKARHDADYRLQEEAWKRVKSKDASFGEKAWSWGVTNAMKAKRFLGLGKNKNSKRSKRKRGKGKCCKKRKCGGGMNFSKIVNHSKKALKNERDLKKAAKLSLLAAKMVFKKGKINKIPRTLKIPHQGGALQILPILSGLSAVGRIAGGIGTVISSANEIRKLIGLGMPTNKAIRLKNAKNIYIKIHKQKNGKIGAGLIISSSKKKS